jgi:hypothetical protein
MTIEIGDTMTWRRVSDDRRRIEESPVKILKVAKNGVIVEMTLENGETRKARVARDRLLPVMPPPAPRPARPRPPASDLPPPPSQPPAPVGSMPKDRIPPMPVGEMPKDRMLGEPAGRIPTSLPKPWDPMIMVGDAERVMHAVSTGTRAMCGHESATGWQWARGFELTCKHCCQKIAEDEFERDGIVQHLRKLGHDGPITREDYISFNWAGCSIRPWTAEHEDSLPALDFNFATLA